MGILDILKPRSALEKAARQVREPYAQPEYRRGAMDKLFELATDDAYSALLTRFTINSSGNIADEEEKRELAGRLASVGEPVVPALQRFIATEKAIRFPVKVLVEVVGAARGLEFLAATLRSFEPLDHRTTAAKKVLVEVVAGLGGPEQAPLVAAYLGDHDDDVQYIAVESVEKLAAPATRDALVEVCTGDRHAARVQRRAAQALVELAWTVGPDFERLSPDLRADHALGPAGQLVRKDPRG